MTHSPLSSHKVTQSTHKAHIWRMIIISSIMHVVCVALGIWYNTMHVKTRTRAHPNTILVTNIVRLGKKDPPKEALLPKIPTVLAPDAPDAPVQPRNIPKQDMPDFARELPPEKKPLENRTHAREHMLNALSRIKQHVVDKNEGDTSGSSYGTSRSTAVLLLEQRFGIQVYDCIKAHYHVLGLDAARVHGRKATLLVRVRPDGSIFDVRSLEKSGVLIFDEAVLRAVQECKRVPPPPEEIRKNMYQHGIEILFEA